MLAHELEALKEQQYCALHQYKTCTNIDKSLKTQLLSAFDKHYIKAMRQGIMAYNNRSTADLLHHLYSTYGWITFTMLTMPVDKLCEPFNPGAPIKEFFDQLDDAKNIYSTRENPILFINSQMVNI
eukprot:9180189-Ditylum_brightwellii.AAC.1